MTDHKAVFIQDKLPSLVGTTPFWLDTICVNQRNIAEQKADIQAVPTTPRQAQKTICIWDNGGFPDCCAEAIGQFCSWNSEGLSMFANHLSTKHEDRDAHESYLERLWTLTEVLLSDCTEFTSCRPRDAKKEKNSYSYWGYLTRI